MDRRIDENVKTVAKEIQGYLVNHPNAADSVEGVLRWWLSQQRFEESIQVVLQALEILVDQGDIDKAITPGGRAVYSSPRADPDGDKTH